MFEVDSDIHSLPDLTDSFEDLSQFEDLTYMNPVDTIVSKYQPLGEGTVTVSSKKNNGLEGRIIKFMRESKDPFNVGTEVDTEENIQPKEPPAPPKTNTAPTSSTEDFIKTSSAALGGLAFGVSNLASGLLAPVVQEKEQEHLLSFQYSLDKQKARDTGMPLANVLGFGAALPQAEIYSGGNRHFTAGQGLDVSSNKLTPSNLNAGYYSF